MELKGGLTEEQLFEAKVGVQLADANKYFIARDWMKLAVVVRELAIIFLSRIREEDLIVNLRARNVPDSEMN